jgi:putative oxidoreductase
MLGAMVLLNGHNGFFLNWNGDQPGEGIQFHLLVLAISVVLMVKGSGARSLDRSLLRSLTPSAPEATGEPERLRAA